MVAAIKRILGASARATVALAGTALVLAAPVSAATVDVTEELPEYDHHSRLSFLAATGESNRVTVALTAEEDGYLTLEIKDAGSPLSAGTGCVGGGAPGQPAFCRLHEVVAHELCIKGCAPPQYGENWRVSMVFDLGDGNDSLLASDLTPQTPVPMVVTSGPGTDQISTAAGDDSVDPGAGADVVETGAGSDRVEATFVPDGPDFYDLGENTSESRETDKLSYDDRLAPVTIQSGEGGAEGEGDELRGVETLVGGSGNDRLVGDGGIRRLEGGDGADVLIGGKGRSRILGGADGDLLVGGPQRDELRESSRDDSGDDVARGMGGGDLIVLGSGNDRAFSGRGDDRLQGGPGHDALGCGPGEGDTVIHPSTDALRNCEWVIYNY
jgi:Ca2+-binding RTX toxin-like protein